MKNVLLTAIGSFSADIVIQRLLAAGYRVLGCDIYPREWVANSLFVSAFYQAPPATEEERYLSFLQELCQREEVSLLLPLTDVEVDVLNANRARFEACGVCLCISSEKALALCRNKKRLEAFLRDQDAPPTIPTRLLQEVSSAPFAYPLVAKPVNGRSSQGLRYLNSDADWQALLCEADPLTTVLQPFISGDIITVDIVRSPAGGPIIAIPRRELLRTPNGAGTSVLVFSDPALEESCRRIATLLEVSGCVNFEFIADPGGRYHFIECNPRFAGGVAFSCLAGYDCVLNHLRCFTGEELEDFSLERPLYIARKYTEYITS